MKPSKQQPDSFDWLVILAGTSILFGCLFVAAQSGCQPAKPKPAPAAQPTPADPNAPVIVLRDGHAIEVTGKSVLPTDVIVHGGYKPDPEGTKAFLESLDKPTIREAGPELFGAPPPEEKKGVFLYRAFRDAYKDSYKTEWVCATQGIGDCVSFGWHHGIGIASAVEWKLGNIAEWHLPATEAIYGGARVEGCGKNGDGSRPVGGYSDGAYGAAAARFVHSEKGGGGVLFRQNYPGHFDLTKYSPQRAKEWGAFGCGGKGDNGWAETTGKPHRVHTVALVKTFEEAAAAIDSGYPVPVCSNQGFSSTRDKDGFCAARGKWGHCMCAVATRYDRQGVLILNSWGPSWVSGPKYPDDQPDGSFWCEKGTFNRMLAGEDSFAVSAVEGFPLRKLDNGDWVNVRRLVPAGQDEVQYALAP